MLGAPEGDRRHGDAAPHNGAVRRAPDEQSVEMRRRLALAETIGRECPSTLAIEIAVSGSTALGRADSHSDLELNFWTAAIPPADERAAWLGSIGATDVVVDVEDSRDGTWWTTWRQDGIWVEAGWQTLAAHDRTVDVLVSGDATDHELLVVARAVLHAVPLRTVGRLADWQRALSIYPTGLADTLLATAVERWQWPHWLAARWAMVDRGERLGLQAMLVEDVQAALRVLFAINHQWESGWKWLTPTSRTLAVQPDRLVERVDGIFAATDPRASVRLCLELVLEVLTLAPRRKAVDRARTTIWDSLSRPT
jgi:hypothetical protein